MKRPLAAKRAFDVAGSLAIIGLTLPVWLVVAAAVRLGTRREPAGSARSVFYTGERVGKDGAVFAMYKFRTMYPGADRGGPAVTGADDVRVTPVGRVLRKSKLDELPQLVNVLRGDMSLVGPRPEAPGYVALYDGRQRQVLTVRPGITGPTQLAYRDEEQLLNAQDVEAQYREEIMPRKLEMDLEYVRTRTFLGDVRLLAATIGIGGHGRVRRSSGRVSTAPGAKS